MSRQLSINDVLKAINDEPEFPDDPPPELIKYIRECIESKDEFHILHMMRQTVRLTKQCIAERVLELPEAGIQIPI